MNAYQVCSIKMVRMCFVTPNGTYQGHFSRLILSLDLKYSYYKKKKSSVCTTWTNTYFIIEVIRIYGVHTQ